MKKNILYTILVLFPGFLSLLSSCRKDLGNYNYQAINEISFPGINTDSGYTVYLGDTLHITPELSATLDKGLSGSYTYAWDLLTNGDGTIKLLSAEKDLNLPVTLSPGTYNISYSVKDNTTGVTWFTETHVTVITPYYQGWLVLNNVNGTARLDFISYLDDTFTLKTDILARLNSGIPPQGEPYQVLFFNSGISPAIMGGVYLLTASGTNRLDAENFAYSPDRNIGKLMLGSPPSDFKADQLIYTKSDQSTQYDNLYIYTDHNLYKNSYGLFSYGSPVSTDGITGEPVKVSPYTASSGGLQTMLIVYNEEERQFMQIQKLDLYDFNKAVYAASALNFPSGKDLLYMTDNDIPSSVGPNYGYAVLKDPGVDKFYMIRFTLQNYKVLPVDYNQEITATDFALAEHYAISPDLGYLFYNVGGKVYEYDLFLKTSKVVLDKGNEKISLLVFDKNKKPDAWKYFLTIGSYDPAGVQGQNGTLANYTVPPVNGNLIEQQKWTGLGQVVSVSYRYR